MVIYQTQIITDQVLLPKLLTVNLDLNTVIPLNEYILHEFIDYFRQRSTSVYVTFLDASKAFDKINHWDICIENYLIGVPLYVVSIMMVS